MRIGIVGAGAVGTYVGVRLSAGGVPVVLVGRRPVDRAGLGAMVGRGPEVRPGPDLQVSTDPGSLADVDVCLVAVKSRDTAAVAETLSSVLRPQVVVVSLQNGLHNPEVLRRGLVQPVAGGVIGFNLVGSGRVRRATRGPLFLEALGGPAGQQMHGLARRLEEAGEEVSLREDIDAVMQGKLLMNLNNGVCAATGLTIRESLRSRDARWCFARCIREGLTVMRRAGMRPATVVALPPAVVARVLRLPDALVTRVARTLISIDPAARSSTLSDLERGRPTEIDELNGEIVRLADGTAPANARVVEIVKAHERRVAGGQSPEYVSPDRLRASLARAAPR